MANPQPISVDEASYRWVRTWHTGRQRGAWVYLDRDLLRRAGLDPDGDIEVMRYAQQERRTRKDGSVAIRARVVLNLRMIPKQEDGDATLPDDSPHDRKGQIREGASA